MDFPSPIWKEAQFEIISKGYETFKTLWEGRQGVDSFYSFLVGGGWLAFYGGAYPLKKEKIIPVHPQKPGMLGWQVRQH